MQNNTTSKRAFFHLFPFLLAGLISGRAGIPEGKPMFKGANLNYQNPIFLQRKNRKLKGYQRSLSTRSFNKNR